MKGLKQVKNVLWVATVLLLFPLKVDGFRDDKEFEPYSVWKFQTHFLVWTGNLGAPVYVGLQRMKRTAQWTYHRFFAVIR